jgi:hypothetical protein
MARGHHLTLLTGIALALGAGSAAAGTCECARPAGDPVSALPRYKAAFAGRVESITDKDGVKQVSFKVVRAWKGGKGKQMTVNTTADECGFTFEEGKDYVVFASGEKGAPLTADTCGPTSDARVASNTIRQLNLNSGYGSAPLRFPEK